eukprot:3017417-Rhodomonas_salina.1
MDGTLQDTIVEDTKVARPADKDPNLHCSSPESSKPLPTTANDRPMIPDDGFAAINSHGEITENTPLLPPRSTLFMDTKTWRVPSSVRGAVEGTLHSMEVEESTLPGTKESPIAQLCPGAK